MHRQLTFIYRYIDSWLLYISTTEFCIHGRRQLTLIFLDSWLWRDRCNIISLVRSRLNAVAINGLTVNPKRLFSSDDEPKSVKFRNAKLFQNTNSFQHFIFRNFIQIYLQKVWSIKSLVGSWVMVQEVVGSNPGAVYWMDIYSHCFVFKKIMFVWKDRK